MPNHIIVMFDSSGSMADGFSGTTAPGAIRGIAASNATKIEEAKAQIVAWLQTSDYDHVTIIRFSSDADMHMSFQLPRDLDRAREFVEGFQARADGNTNLASALTAAIETGLKTPEDWFVRYLIVTDGLSHTQSADVDLVGRIRKSQGIDALLIDPTPEAETHLRRICVRGRYIPIYGAPDLGGALADRQRFYQSRTESTEAYAIAVERVRELSRRMATLFEGVDLKALRRELREEGNLLQVALASAAEREYLVRERIARPDLPAQVLQEEVAELVQLCSATEEFLSRASHQSPRFVVSLARPRRLSKGLSSWFLAQIFPPEASVRARNEIAKIFESTETEDTQTESRFKPNSMVEIELSSSEIDFSPSVRTLIQHDGAVARFWGKPKDACHPGRHGGLLTVKDGTTGQQYASVAFSVDIVDYAFDHVSRPLLGGVASAVVFVCSVASFALTFLGKVDKAFGLASGAAAGFIVALVWGWTAYSYRNRSVTTMERV